MGGDLAITINWEGTADVLIDRDGPTVRRIDAPVDARLIAELKEKLPDYVRAFEPDGMTPAEFYDYGGVELFRDFIHERLEAVARPRGRTQEENLMAKESKLRGSLRTDPKVSRAKRHRARNLDLRARTNMMCYFYIEKGAELAMHTHLQSQIGIVIKGRVDFVKGDGEILELASGDSYYFAPDGSPRAENL